MPNPVPTEDSLAFGRRLVALMEHARHDRQGAGAYLAKRYKVSTVTANAWLNGEHKCSSARARRIADDHGCTFESLYFGPKLIFPAEESRQAESHGAPRRLFTKERRASDDVQALQIGIESLVVALLKRVPGSAAAFLEDVTRVADEEKFSPEQGFLGALVDIAHGVQRAEAAADQVLQRAGSAGRTKRGK